MKDWLVKKWDREEFGGSEGVARELGLTLPQIFEKAVEQFESLRKDFPHLRQTFPIPLIGESNGRPVEKVVRIDS